jgi:hypothetical protein
MRADQKRKRAQLETKFKPSRKSIEISFSRLMKELYQRYPERKMPIILYTDEKKDYQRALWNHQETKEKMFSGQWRHHMISSKLGRNHRNPLFSVNYIDREIRKDMASQTRETVQFPRNVSNAMLRMNLYLFDHNVRKPYRINDREKRKTRHVQMAGLERETLEVLTEGFFSQRIFKPKGLELSDSAWMTIHRRWMTPLKVRPEKLWKYLAA